MNITSQKQLFIHVYLIRTNKHNFYLCAMENLYNSKILNTFTREFDIDVISETLILHQILEGHVSCVVWDAAMVLAKYLEMLYLKKRDFLKDQFVLELGAGLGCVGLVAASLGANVTLTDLPEALPLLQYNVDENRNVLTEGSVKVCSLSWGSKINLEKIPSKILLADCIYYKESIDSLIKTLLDYSDNSTEIIIAQELRDTDKQKENWQHFLSKMEKDFVCIPVPIADLHGDFSCDEIKILKFYRK